MVAPLLIKRAILLAKVEVTEGVDASPTPAADALLVNEPDFAPDLTALERNPVRFDIGMLPHIMGRKVGGMTFQKEMRSNGKTNSGLIADVAQLGVLLKGCAMSETAQAGTGTLGPVIADPTNDAAEPADLVWAATTGSNFTQPVYYDIEVTTGGISGTAEVKITPDAQAIADSEDSAQTAVVVTSATALQLKSGGGGAAITPTWTGSLVLGDKYRIQTYSPSIAYRPISTSHDSLTLYLYFDGTLHKMFGSRGTVTFSADAGGLGLFTFTFTGTYEAMTDVALPTSTVVHEAQLPSMFELSKLRVDDFDSVVANVSFDAANNVVIREDSRSSDGYSGVLITSRNPTGGIDPETTLIANYDYWLKLKDATQVRLACRFGVTAGNIIWFLAPKTQYTGLSYQARDELRVYDAGLRFARDQGNDDYEFIFA